MSETIKACLCAAAYIAAFLGMFAFLQNWVPIRL